MFGREITDTLVSRVGKIIPREVCSQLSKPEIKQQDHCNPPTDPSLYSSMTVRCHSPHFTGRGSEGQQVKGLALGFKSKSVLTPKPELFQLIATAYQLS